MKLTTFFKPHYLCVVLLFQLNISLKAQDLTTNKSNMIFSAIKGNASKPDTLLLANVKNSRKVAKPVIQGKHAAYFKVVSSLPTQMEQDKSAKIALIFKPDVDFIGIATATLQVAGFKIPLTGLSTKGLEGENEPPLADVVAALGYSIDLGWTSLANTIKSGLQGEELAPTMFTKAGEGKVEMIPVARYSPDFLLNFGYYTNTDMGPKRYHSGILATAEKYPEHQQLFPALASGETSFDPGKATFGFYAIGPTHTAYSEDHWNMLYHPDYAAHAARIYPVKGESGIVANTYLLCMEEAGNGDYNDYVFLLKNVKPLSDGFASIMNGQNFDGWYKWLETKGKNNDPDNIFTIEDDGVIHDMGTEVGYIMTEKSYKNFHMYLEFKWGEKRWPPRESLKRDSGICYNIPEDEPDGIWPQSVECQIQEGDVGDFWLLGHSTIQVDGKQNAPSPWTRMQKKKDAEKPNGEWNSVEVISFNGKCVHIVNGEVVNFGVNSSLVGGKILLQSEFAEIYYRNIKLREL